MDFKSLKVGMRVEYYNISMDKRKFNEDDNPIETTGVVKYAGPNLMMFMTENGRKYTVTTTEIMLNEISIKANGKFVSATINIRPYDEQGWQGRGMRGR